MTSDTDVSLTSSRGNFLSPPTGAERARLLHRARRHTRAVKYLRYVLPILAAGVFGLYFFSPQISVSIGDMDASVAGVVIDKGNVRMVNPKLEGVNDKRGNYVVTAKYAEQAVANPDVIHLTDLKAEMNNAQKGWSRLSAPEGKFQTRSEKLELVGDIRAAQSNGLTALLTRARIDMQSQVVVSDEPVKVAFPQGNLESLSMRINMELREVAFDGDVRVRMTQDAAEKERTAASKPAGTGSSFASALRSDEPIDIFAPKLTIYDTRKLAHFQGGVTTDQAGSRMTSRELRVVYSDENAQQTDAGAQSGTSLSLLEAIGDVRIDTADGRRAQAARLTYESAKQRLVLDQGVTLSQGGNTLKGERLVSDLEANITRFPPAGRVRGHFEPDEKPGPKPAAAPVAQSTPSAGGGAHLDLSSTRGQPIDVESDTLVIDDNKQLARFSGKVVASQGDMNMRSRVLNVKYTGETGAAGAGENGEGSQIASIRAEGKVLINTADGQTATSDWAFFDEKAQTVTIGGNVVLSQGENVIKGDELVIDLTTNRSRFVHRGDPSRPQRVRGLFMPQQSGPGASTAKPDAQ